MPASDRKSRATRLYRVLIFPPSLLFLSFRHPAPVFCTRRPALLLDLSPANAARQPYDHVHLRGRDAGQHAADLRRLAREPTQTRPMARLTQTAWTWARRSALAPASARNIPTPRTATGRGARDANIHARGRNEGGRDSTRGRACGLMWSEHEPTRRVRDAQDGCLHTRFRS
jgi:hypothetical protein